MTEVENQEAVLPEELDVWQQTLGWQPHPQQQVSYQRLYTEILSGNQQLNLTRITDPKEFLEKHLWDSLRGIERWLAADALSEATLSESALTVLDVGTGAGFPGIPIAIACPHWRVTLLDSTRKKIAFLDALIATLGLSQVQTIVGRAEEVGQMAQHREAYDLVLIRAVAEASVCAEYALPLLKLNGMAILYRGQWLEAETQPLRAAVQRLGGEIDRIENFVTPFSQSIRHCIYLKKIKPTPVTFPRPVGVPTQKPL
jgi:16S rRNA (guanine527-N7)-methyltransferase